MLKSSTASLEGQVVIIERNIDEFERYFFIDPPDELIQFQINFRKQVNQRLMHIARLPRSPGYDLYIPINNKITDHRIFLKTSKFKEKVLKLLSKDQRLNLLVEFPSDNQLQLRIPRIKPGDIEQLFILRSYFANSQLQVNDWLREYIIKYGKETPGVKGANAHIQLVYDITNPKVYKIVPRIIKGNNTPNTSNLDEIISLLDVNEVAQIPVKNKHANDIYEVSSYLMERPIQVNIATLETRNNMKEARFANLLLTPQYSDSKLTFKLDYKQDLDFSSVQFNK